MFAELSKVQLLIVAIVPTLFAITLHEVAHGWVALRLGDTTAYAAGRLTLNPFRHIDLIGTILVPAVLIMTLGFAIGWAKPVPVTWRNLRNPKRDISLVSAAGPFANVLMAIGWGIIMKISTLLAAENFINKPLFYMGLFGVMINSVFAIFNLLPIPPLDGGRLLVNHLPARLSYKVNQVEPYGMYILLGLMITGLLWKIIGPAIDYMMYLVTSLVGL